MRREKSVLTLLAGVALFSSACAFVQPDARVPGDATGNPDKFAWETLVDIGRSAHNGSQDAIWETWALSQDVYVHSGLPVFPMPSHHPLVLRRPAVLAARSPIQKPPDGKTQEIRMNREAFDYIVANNLWNQRGQLAWFDKRMPVSVPKGAIEIKAEWKAIAEGDKPIYHWNVDGQGNTWGLIALHVTTKDLPNWFWATFEHIKNEHRCEINGCNDTFGVDANKKPTRQWLNFLRDHGMGDEWTYYRLTGSQTDFVDSTGAPLRLGNSEIEGVQGLMEKSSCISCHAQSRMSREGFALPHASLGVPVADCFKGQMQMDFMWSLGEPWDASLPPLPCEVVPQSKDSPHPQ